jgi:hypothetical protein
MSSSSSSFTAGYRCKVSQRFGLLDQTVCLKRKRSYFSYRPIGKDERACLLLLRCSSRPRDSNREREKLLSKLDKNTCVVKSDCELRDGVRSASGRVVASIAPGNIINHVHDARRVHAVIAFVKLHVC